MKNMMGIVLLSFILAGSAIAQSTYSVTITKVTMGQEDSSRSTHPRPIIYFTFSNGGTDHYTLSDYTPAEMAADSAKADLMADSGKVRTWSVGDTLVINRISDCFLSTDYTNVSKNPKQQVCFM